MIDTKRLYLEFLRGIAALVVVLYHYLEIYAKRNNLHFFFTSWGTDAVMIFFILSGVVINISQRRNPKNRIQFIKKRLLRLYPQFLVGFILGIFVLIVLKMPLPDWKMWIGNLLMLGTLQGYIVKCITTNSPIWSLSFEMFFYFLFSLSIGQNQRQKIWILFILSTAILPFYYSVDSKNICSHVVAMMSFFAIWLIGYFIYEYRKLIKADVYTAIFSVCLLPLASRIHFSDEYYDPLKFIVFAIVAIPLYRYCLEETAAGFKIRIVYLIPLHFILISFFFWRSESMLLSKFIYLTLPYIALLMFHSLSRIGWRPFMARIVDRTGNLTGKYSYSLYIIHYPVLYLFSALFHSLAAYILCSIPVIVGLAYLLESYMQTAFIRLFQSGETRRD